MQPAHVSLMVRHATVGVFRDPGVGANRSRQCLVEPPIYSLAIVAELQQKKKKKWGEVWGGRVLFMSEGRNHLKSDAAGSSF